jgi:hypothetical protein
VPVRQTLAAFVAVLVLSLSLSSAVCDASCAFAFSQLQTNQSTQMSMQAMDQVHCQHETAAGQTEQPSIQSSSFCQHHHPCVDPEKQSVQKLRPAAPQVAVAVLTVIAHVQRQNAFGVTPHSRIDNFTFTLPNTPSTSLRI